MADISKLNPGPVEKPGVPGRVFGGRFAAGANNIASGKDGPVGEVSANSSLASQDRSFLYHDYAERYVEDQPAPGDEPPAIDGSGLNKAPILETQVLDVPALDVPVLESKEEGSETATPPVQVTTELATRVTDSYQSAAKTVK